MLNIKKTNYIPQIVFPRNHHSSETGLNFAHIHAPLENDPQNKSESHLDSVFKEYKVCFAKNRDTTVFQGKLCIMLMVKAP